MNSAKGYYWETYLKEDLVSRVIGALIGVKSNRTIVTLLITLLTKSLNPKPLWNPYRSPIEPLKEPF